VMTFNQLSTKLPETVQTLKACYVVCIAKDVRT